MMKCSASASASDGTRRDDKKPAAFEYATKLQSTVDHEADTSRTTLQLPAKKNILSKHNESLFGSQDTSVKAASRMKDTANIGGAATEKSLPLLIKSGRVNKHAIKKAASLTSYNTVAIPPTTHANKDKKPAALKDYKAPPKKILVLVRNAAAKHNKSLPGALNTSVKAANTKKDAANSGGTAIEKPLSLAKKDGKVNKYAIKRAPSLTSTDTSTIASTTEESSVISVPSTHFLAQTWWREKTVRKGPGVSVPFSLESCVTMKENPDEAPRGGMRLRTSSRRKDVSMEMACPVCKKSFQSFLTVSLPVECMWFCSYARFVLNDMFSYVFLFAFVTIQLLTEDTMSRHVERCSRKFLSVAAPASRRSSDSAQQATTANLAVVAALSRSHVQDIQQQSESQKQLAENDRQARRAAEWAARKASMYFLTTGSGKQALDEWVLGDESTTSCKKTKTAT